MASPSRPSDWYVETYRPLMSQGRSDRPIKTRVKVHPAHGFMQDHLHPSLTSLFFVANVLTKEEAMACVIERAAGINVSNVRAIISHAMSLNQLPAEG